MDDDEPQSPAMKSDNVLVSIRVRPLNEREKSGGNATNVRLCLNVERKTAINFTHGKDERTFTFDYVATQDCE